MPSDFGPKITGSRHRKVACTREDPGTLIGPGSLAGWVGLRGAGEGHHHPALIQRPADPVVPILVSPPMQQSAPARSGGDITTASHHPRAAGPSRQSRGATSAVGLTPRRRCPREGLARPAERWESRRRLGPGTTALLPRCPSSRGLLGRATNHGGTLAACSPLLGQAVASTGTAGQPPGEPREPQGKQGRGSPPGTQKPEAVVTKTPIP